MKNYGVKAMAKLSGVSVRTLHHYDKIDLLKPLNRTNVGYRYYGETELLRLQQILFYKELGFSLKEIKAVLDDPDFDLFLALEGHKLALKAQKERIDTLLSTIDTTIHHLKKATIMKNPKDLYKGLPKEMGTTYRKEAKDKWGEKTIEQAEKDLLKLGKAGFDSLKEEQNILTDALFAAQNKDPESEQVQRLISQHYQIICQFWGSSVERSKQPKIYAGLGQLYMDDERYLARDGQAQPEFARFMQKAMTYFVERRLS